MNNSKLAFSHDFFEGEDGLKTSFYISKDEEKPLAILVHGYGGNAYGMKFLAEELSREFRILILEMPNHGKSGALESDDLADYRAWAENIIAQASARFQTPAIIVTHSMSCYLFSHRKISCKIPVILLTPVFETAWLYNLFARATYNFRILAILQNLPIFAPFKGFAILRFFKFSAVKNMLDNLIHSAFISPQKIILQSKMAKIPLAKPLLSPESKNVFLVIEGAGDGMSRAISKESKEKFFTNSHFETLNGGHLLPIETPKIVADTIIDHFEKIKNRP